MAEQLSGTDTIGGATVLEPGVLDAIAATAASDVEGVHSLGRTGIGGALDTVGGGERGVSSEHGETQAAFDFDLVVEWGHNIPTVVSGVRNSVADAIRRMTDLDAVEINIHVRGIHREEPPVRRQLQ